MVGLDYYSFKLKFILFTVSKVQKVSFKNYFLISHVKDFKVNFQQKKAVVGQFKTISSKEVV